jgi:sensor histidine kinase YesM
VACAIGYVAGTTIVDAAFGYSTWSQDLRNPAALLADIALTATFATLIAGWFYTRSRAQAHNAQVTAALHDATLARLVLLQSQLEPHMLFNTLANLRVLIAADPERAQAMLDRLIDFLRATLNASRVAEHALKDEFARVDDYLALMKVRMGDRLHTALDLPPDLAALPVPPLLLQPLVENAIKHGLEPKRGPGELRVTATRDGDALVLAVIDSGRGIDAAAADKTLEPGAGFGLAQVRERLQTLHGGDARFTLAARAEGGTRAEIRLPLTETPSSTDR